MIFLYALIYVYTLVGESVVVTYVYRLCFVMFVGVQTLIDLVILDMLDFNVILGMTWLSLYYAVLNCNTKTITFEISSRDRLKREVVNKPKPATIISYIRARRIVVKGCWAYLDHLWDIVRHTLLLC